MSNTKPRHYAGIGSRSIPLEYPKMQIRIAKLLSEYNWTLNSGGAAGSDNSFLAGATKANIYLPWASYNANLLKELVDGVDRILVIPSTHSDQDSKATTAKAIELAKSVVPYWSKLPMSVWLLHTRNVYQILGTDLNTPVEFVVYWAPLNSNGSVKGGTRVAIDLATQLGIPTFNLLNSNPENFSFLEPYLKQTLEV